MSLVDDKRMLIRNLNAPIDEMVSNYLNSYDDDSFTASYVGIIVDNNDPEKLGRCRINVYTVFDGVPTDSLPWALPDMSFIGSNVGSFIVPTVGTVVSVYFQNGDIYSPHYTTKVIVRNKMPKNKDIDYPNTMVFFETDNGDSFEINRAKSTTTYTHSSGTTIHIDADGSVSIESENNVNILHNNACTISGDYVQPTGRGGFCAIPICPFTGLPHVGNVIYEGGQF